MDQKDVANMLKSAPRPLSVCFLISDILPQDKSMKDAAQGLLQESDTGEYYEVEFGTGPLGLGFRKQKDDSTFMVERVKGAAEEKGIPPGDFLYSVGGTVLGPDMDQKDVVNMLMSAPRPLTICLRVGATVVAGGEL